MERRKVEQWRTGFGAKAEAYRVLKPQGDNGRWNPQGTCYTLKGLTSLVTQQRNRFEFEIPLEIALEIAEYLEAREEKAKPYRR